MRIPLKAAAVLATALALAAGATVYRSGTETTETCTVDSKSPVYGMNGQIRAYRIDTDCGTFDVDHWDSLDLYRSLNVGGTYTLTITETAMDAFGRHSTVTAAQPAT